MMVRLAKTVSTSQGLAADARKWMSACMSAYAQLEGKVLKRQHESAKWYPGLIKFLQVRPSAEPLPMPSNANAPTIRSSGLA